MKKVLLCLAAIAYSFALHAQCSSPINHWESCVLDNMTWKYKVPTAAIPNWQQPTFNDAAWASGIGGMGYGDGDDNTLVPNGTVTVYMRKTFTIIDTSVIRSAVFCMDFDDGFVAYLNGKEIARSNMNANQQWNSLAPISTEASLYQNLQPAYFELSPAAIDTLLVNGTNVLCVETHNNSSSSSDLTSRPFLQLGITNTSSNYSALPGWFTPPVELYSNLPIMCINTLGQTIVDNPRILCDMGIINNGPGVMNCIYDPYNDYNGKITIEFRGSTSQSFPKKPYGFSTTDTAGNSIKASLLGYPAESDWILLNPYTDKSFMRDVLVYNMGRSLNWYASRTKFVELVLNGQNQGIYVLLEKIKRDKNRVNVAKITPTANSGDSLTGGYIFKVDKTTGSSGAGWNTSQGIFLQNHDPDWNQITSTQLNYLKNYVDSFESALWSPNFTDPNTGYRKFANPYSFVDFFIVNEVSNNIDGYRLSTFIHKDTKSRCGRFTMGPLWDFNLSFGNGDYCNGYPTSGWQLYQGCGLTTGGGTWMDKMLQDQWFKNLLNCRWHELRQGVLSTATLLNEIDTTADYLRQAAARDSALWQTIGIYIWPNGWVANSWQGEIDSMKLWLTNKLAWIDANMFPTTQSCGALSNLSVTVDEINFNSESTIDAGDWIELYNYGSTTVDLSNAVLLNGDSYEKYCVIPNNTHLNAGQRLVIYEDSLKFAPQFPSVTNKIGPLCFKLSNTGQKLTIRDKDNKLITSFTYSSDWQCSAAGYGRTLQRLSPTSNPDSSSSWFAGCVGGSPGVAYTPCVENPICSEINYNSISISDAGDWIELYNKDNTTFNLGGWSLRDGSGANLYTLPAGYSLGAHQYLVLYADATKFNAMFPTVFNKLGPIGFGFSSSGDVIRLYDNTGKLHYSVCYSPYAPWPTTPNGGGKTLENGQYSGNHNAASSWFAGCPNGSPGVVYSPNCYPLGINNLQQVPEQIQVYPNPADEVLYIRSIQVIEEAEVLDALGHVVIQQHEVHDMLDIHALPAGAYSLRARTSSQTFNLRFVKQ